MGVPRRSQRFDACGGMLRGYPGEKAAGGLRVE